MAVIDWSSAATEGIGITIGALLTAPWWLKLLKPLTTICKTQMFRARLEQDNATKISAVDAKVEHLGSKVMVNGEQTAISIDQNKRILELLESATMQADEAGSVNWVSHRWTVLAGIQRDESFGNGWMSAIRADDQERVIKLYENAIAKSQPLNIDFHFGTGQRVRQVMEPIRYDGRIVAWGSEFERIDGKGIPIGPKPVAVVPAVL